MANAHSFRHGQMFLVQGAVNSGTVLEKGDMVWLDTDDVKPASDYAWTSNLAGTQAAFANKFLGICQHQSANGDTDPVDVDMSATSVYEFTVASATYELGDDLGADEDTDAASPGALHDQVLEAVSSVDNAVCRAVERKASASTKLRVVFASAYLPGSGNVNAAVG